MGWRNKVQRAPAQSINAGSELAFRNGNDVGLAQSVLGGSFMASVLLVEDESLIRMMIADMLAELGHSLAGEANDLQSGLSLASTPGIDAAILDIQLGAHSSDPIAEVLQRNGVPFCLCERIRGPRC